MEVLMPAKILAENNDRTPGHIILTLRFSGWFYYAQFLKNLSSVAL